MKRLKVKIMAMVLMIILITLMIPVNVFAAEANIQAIKTENEDYIIYVEGLEKAEFEFAISTSDKATDEELYFTKSVKDGEGNKVALIEKSKVISGTNYIYIKNGTETTINEIDFADETQIFDIAKMQKVEKTTQRIETELLTNIEERNEVIDGVQYTEKVGGLKVNEEDGTTYYYKSTKLPAEKYSELQKLANELNGEGYTQKDMYGKIQFAKEFYNLYEELLKNIELTNSWSEVENMIIKQPIEAQKDEQYVVFIKKVSQTDTIDDVKFLVSYREDEEEKIPGRTETKVVQETAKLPVTGDSIVLFVLLAIIVLALIIVFVRMKKLQNQESKH